MVKNNAKELSIMQYGFSIYKHEIKEYIITDNIENVIERVKKEKEQENDPLSAIINWSRFSMGSMFIKINGRISTKFSSGKF